MLKAALSYGHPVAIRFPKGKGTGASVDAEFKDLPLGRSELLKDGTDLLLAYGGLVYPALEAAKKLEEDGLSFAVVDAKFAKPLDEEMILRFARAGRTIMTAEEGIVAGGFGSAVREFLDRQRIFNIRFKAIGLPLEIYPVGKASQIKKMFRLDPAGLVEQIKEFCRQD
jgi:1-deoxy-D-xylulose-5-phosphate synthase